MPVFYFFAVVVILLGVSSLISGIRFQRYVRQQSKEPLPDYTPFASVIAPSRGLESGLRENVLALLAQDYPSYEVIFVTGEQNDPARVVVDEITGSCIEGPHPVTQLVIAGQAQDSGQKVHNLRVAVGRTKQASEVFVFVDSDARPGRNWLRSLVAPLSDNTVGAATGYRWFVPASSRLASQLRSVWNASIASALGSDGHKNFCWGGSTAIRRSTFEKLHVADRWRGTVSDDFTLMRTLREAKLPIVFVPACLVASVGDCTVGELMEFTTRQLKITRVYASHFWRSVLLGSLLFSIIFYGGLALLIIRIANGRPFLWLLTFVIVIFALGSIKGWIRLNAVASVLHSHAITSVSAVVAHVLLWPLTALIYLYNALAAAFSRRINWRGITYELKSPTEAVIISRE